MVLKECVLFMKDSLLWYIFIYLCNHLYSTIYNNVDIIITIYFYVCRWKMKRWNIKKQVDQENILG
jgi:hypothetical protein